MIQPNIMGIINITPDSFSDGGQHLALESAFNTVDRYIAAGVDIIDIGAESTRPGSIPVTEEEECARLIPFLTHYFSRYDIPLSVDTQKAGVAKVALEHGATIINDVSGLTHDPNMVKVVSDYDATVVIMHMQQSPDTMQDDPRYTDVVEEVALFFKSQIALCDTHGISNIILDPGIGFGKTVEHNCELLKEISHFSLLGYPVLIGTSRKSFIGGLTGADIVDRLPGSLSSGIMAWLNGASYLRVHDVEETKQALQVAAAIKEGIC